MTCHLDFAERIPPLASLQIAERIEGQSHRPDFNKCTNNPLKARIDRSTPHSLLGIDLLSTSI